MSIGMGKSSQCIGWDGNELFKNRVGTGKMPVGIGTKSHTHTSTKLYFE